MQIEFDWMKLVENASIGGALILIIWLGYKGFVLMIEQWKNSTEAVNKNTEAFTQLSGVFAKSAEREEQFQGEVRAFQKESLEIMRDNASIGRETNRRVRDLQDKLGKGE